MKRPLDLSDGLVERRIWPEGWRRDRDERRMVDGETMLEEVR